MSDPITRLNAALEGRYAIERELGEGGMATVYLAADLKHERKVALKVLKPELAAVVGAERFLAEIKVTANLQHPNILPLHDSGEADGFLFYVMPYVEGDTLKDRLDREHQLPVSEAVHIATDMAEALDYAHRQGVIHRDIKPANVLLLEGKPVISDFGIALALSSAGAGERLTETGLSLGTPHYMSPEQATGEQHVGPPSDTYALGAVLYEMLVGEPPYPGTTAQAVLGKIIAGKPVSATDQRPSVPANVDAAVRCALEKLPADRFTSAQDFARALGDEHFRYGEAVAASTTLTRLATTHEWLGPAVVLSITVLAIGMVWGWMRDAGSVPELQEVSRFRVELPMLVGLGSPPGPGIAISPNGKYLAYSVGPGIYIRPLERLTATLIPNTQGASNLFFSSDSQWLAFHKEGELQKVAVTAGAPVTIAVGAEMGVGGSWGPDDVIIFAPNFSSGLWRVSGVGGTPEQIAEVGVRPHILPDGRAVLFTVQGRITVLTLETGETKDLIEGESVRYLPTGHLLYSTREGSLQVVPFDPVTLQVRGGPMAIDADGQVQPSGVVQFGTSDNGTLVFLERSRSESALVLVDREGAVRPLIDERRAFAGPRFSPSGDRVAVGTARGNTFDIWIAETEGGGLARFTLGGGLNVGPVWSVDGERVAFATASSGRIWYNLFWQRADGSGSAERILTASADTMFETGDRLTPQSWSPDGRSLVFEVRTVTQGTDIWVTDLDGDRTPRALLNTSFNETFPVISPNGRWLAYASEESGGVEVYVQSFPDIGNRRLVSRGGGTEPLWTKDGREIIYRDGGRIMTVSVQMEPVLALGSPELLFEVRDGSGWRGYDIHPNGQQFVMIQSSAEGSTHVVVVQNWFEELKRLVPN